MQVSTLSHAKARLVKERAACCLITAMLAVALCTMVVFGGRYAQVLSDRTVPDSNASSDGYWLAPSGSMSASWEAELLPAASLTANMGPVYLSSANGTTDNSPGNSDPEWLVHASGKYRWAIFAASCTVGVLSLFWFIQMPSTKLLSPQPQKSETRRSTLPPKPSDPLHKIHYTITL